MCMCWAVECAGGASCVAPGIDGEHSEPLSLLDIPVSKLEYKCGVAYGSVGEVETFKRFMF
jgi:hypothetical protein